VFDAKAARGFGVAARSEGGPIVGHDALDRDVVLVEVSAKWANLDFSSRRRLEEWIRLRQK
jgi:hypothetical protein